MSKAKTLGLTPVKLNTAAGDVLVTGGPYLLNLNGTTKPEVADAGWHPIGQPVVIPKGMGAWLMAVTDIGCTVQAGVFEAGAPTDPWA